MWPDAVTYREAVQEPTQAFHDPTLAGSRVRLDRLGLPVAYTGRFAVVFPLTDAGGTAWALRCFTTPERPGQMPRALRYALIDRHLERLPDRFVEFVFHERGIRVGGAWYPAIAMGWADGITLGRWTEENYRDPDALRTLAATVDDLRRDLEDAGIAHGDWQHDNLIVADGGKRATLVDYDGMFVPELAGTHAPERGHPNYQHPARTSAHFGVGLDRFPCLVVRTALLALAAEPSLWSRFSDPDRLLFSKSDLAEPSASPLFGELVRIAERHVPLGEAFARLQKSLADGAGSELLPMPTPESAMLAPLAKLAKAEERDEETWWSIADENAPWWRQKVSSRRIALDPAWAERLASLDKLIEKQEKAPVLQFGTQTMLFRPTAEAELRLRAFQKIREWEALLARERDVLQWRIDRARAVQRLDPEAREKMRAAFLEKSLASLSIPTDFPPRVGQARIATAAALQNSRVVLPKFLRVAECKRVLYWLDEQVTRCNVEFGALFDPQTLAREEEELREKQESFELTANRLAKLKDKARYGI